MSRNTHQHKCGKCKRFFTCSVIDKYAIPDCKVQKKSLCDKCFAAALIISKKEIDKIVEELRGK